MKKKTEDRNKIVNEESLSITMMCFVLWKDNRKDNNRDSNFSLSFFMSSMTNYVEKTLDTCYDCIQEKAIFEPDQDSMCQKTDDKFMSIFSLIALYDFMFNFNYTLHSHLIDSARIEATNSNKRYLTSHLTYT